MRVLFVSDTHLGIDTPARPRVVRRRRGEDFFRNFERALDVARRGEGFVVLDLIPSGLGGFEFRPLPARPMVTCALSLNGVGDAEALTRVRAAIDATPADAVVRLRLASPMPAGLTARSLREMAGARDVSVRPFDARNNSPAPFRAARRNPARSRAWWRRR